MDALNLINLLLLEALTFYVGIFLPRKIISKPSEFYFFGILLGLVFSSIASAVVLLGWELTYTRSSGSGGDAGMAEGLILIALQVVVVLVCLIVNSFYYLKGRK